MRADGRRLIADGFQHPRPGGDLGPRGVSGGRGLAYRFERLDHGTEGEDFQGGRVSVSYQFGGLHR